MQVLRILYVALTCTEPDWDGTLRNEHVPT